MSLGPSDDYPAPPPQFDLRNVAVGAVVSSLLVGLLGYGTILFFQAITSGEEGVNIGGALLASLGCLLAVALGAAFTARRARWRASQPMPEGVSAGLVGFTLAVLAGGYLFFVVRDVPVFEVLSMLPLLLLGVGAALVGAALGSMRTNKGQTR
jgi:hypothetical protein